VQVTRGFLALEEVKIVGARLVPETLACAPLCLERLVPGYGKLLFDRVCQVTSVFRWTHPQDARVGLIALLVHARSLGVSHRQNCFDGLAPRLKRACGSFPFHGPSFSRAELLSSHDERTSFGQAQTVVERRFV